jgi:flagellar biosynthesis GTPase FlhF
MTMITTIERVWVDTTLRVVRFPITAAERVLGKNGGNGGGERVSAWVPAVTFDRFGAVVKQTLGSLLRNDELVEEGRLLEEKVARVTTAVQLELAADERRARADAKAREHHQQADQQRQKAERDAKARKERLERERHERERQLEQEKAEKASRAKKAEQTAKKAIDKQERTARRGAIAEERQALGKERDAVAAKRAEKAVDDAIETSKARRKAQS